MTLLEFLFLIRFGEAEEYGINKTVNWGFDWTGFSYFIVYILFGFFIGFCLLALLKAKTNFILSILHFASVSSCALFLDNYRNMVLRDNIMIIGIALFISILCNSIYLKIKNHIQ